tara:strand:+ start:13 stop:732 length:720 start_codon:yes stop_codon:yes gene_type:complete
MSKKELNQNDKIKLDLIDTFEPDFIFNDKPLNRFKINNSNNAKNILDKAEKLSDLKKIINSIKSCDLKTNSKNLILGDGNANSPLMLIGEAPGAEEDLSCLAFQGEVGKLLKKMLIAINIKINDVYLTYSVNFRPPNDRKPTTQEIKRYSEFLKEHIAIIDPEIIILMGSTAMESLTGINNKISSERGDWKEVIIKDKNYPIMITFSPSYLIRFPENKKYSWEDLKKIRQKIKDLNIKI